MAEEHQPSTFDVEVATKHRHKKRQEELDTLLVETIGTAAAKKWQKKNALITAKLEEIHKKPLSSQMQEVIDRMDARVKEKTKPLANEYTLLGIEQSATKREIRNAYRRKARKLHPDVGGDAEDFKRLYEAYRKVLKLAPE